MLLEIKRVPLQRIKRNHGERLLVRRCENNRCRDTSCERLAPGSGAYAPSVARVEAGKTEFRRRRNEVIAAPTREREKFLSYLHADNV